MENTEKDKKLANDENNEELINIKEEKDLIKSLPSSEINPIISIKDLINALKEKINVYEKQIKKLIDDKVKLQMDMNEMILQNLQSKKKANNNENINNKENSIDLNNLDLSKNFEKEQNKIIISSLADINKKILEQNKELKEQIEIFKNNLETYKKKMEDFKNNKNNNGNVSKDKCPFCEEKKLKLIKVEEEKEEIYSTITSLRKQIDEIKLNEKLKKEKKNRREKIKKTESLPNIEQYFILNNKFQLVDSDKDLWHMKKCLKFQEFKKSFAGKNISPEDILKEFVDEYDSKNEEERSDDERNYMEALNMSANESEDFDHRNKYLPPLPSTANNSKKKNNNRNNETDNGKNIQEINSSDIQINFDETEENKKEEENSNDKVKNEEKKNDNNVGNSNGNSNSNLMNNMNEKEETSFNLSDNTD